MRPKKDYEVNDKRRKFIVDLKNGSVRTETEPEKKPEKKRPPVPNSLREMVESSNPSELASAMKDAGNELDIMRQAIERVMKQLGLGEAPTIGDVVDAFDAGNYMAPPIQFQVPPMTGPRLFYSENLDETTDTTDEGEDDEDKS